MEFVPDPATIELDKTSETLNSSKSTVTLTATVKNSTATVTWTSSDDAVATVAVDADDSKVATVTLADGVTTGTATITATLGTGDDAPTATCAVTVSSHEHNWGEGTVSTPATCNEAGVRTFTCTGDGTCPDGGTRTEPITALGHNTAENATAVADVTATCTADGLTGKKICGRNNNGTTCQEVVVAGTATPRTGHLFPAGSAAGDKCTKCDVTRPDRVEFICQSTTAGQGVADAVKGYVIAVADNMLGSGDAGKATIPGVNGGSETVYHVKFAGNASALDFVAPGDGTLDIYFVVGQGDGFTVTENGTAVTGSPFTIPATASDSTITNAEKFSIDVTNGKTYEIKRNGNTQTRLAALVWEAPEETPDEVNKTALTAAIAAATAKKTGVEISTDGTDIDQDKTWVTQTAMDTLEAAIVAAQTVADKADATQTEVDDAKTAMEAATAAFTPAAGAKLKTMTVSAENVTATYNGEAKTITVTGAPTGATITYCATADGTYTATQPEMKNVSGSPYTVYYKVNATGYAEATGSATVTINKATPTITVRADLTDDIPYAQTDVTFTATGVPKDSETVLTGHCTQAEADVNITFAWNTEKTVYSGVSHVAENTTAAAKTHDVAFTWAGDDNYNAATIANVTLTQVAQGAVGTTKATGLAVANGFASKGVTATAADSVTITVDEAAILAAFAADKATWTVQQTVTKDGVKGTPGAKWKLDGTDASNELDVVGTKIGDWFCILKGVDGDTPTMPDAGEYRMEYKFFDSDDNHVATYYYMVDRAVTAAPVEYTVTVNAGANGTASASVAKATAGTEVTLTFTPDSGYVVDSILAVDADSHTVTIGNGGKFTMPASNVTITVSFKANGGEEPPVTEDGYILDANDLEVTDNTVQLGGTKWGTDGFFEVCSTDAGKPFTPATAASFDGKTWDKTITMGGKFAYNSGNPKAALKFTVTKDSTVKVWWANAKDTEARNLAIYDSTGGLVVAATASAEGSYAVENVFEHDLSAGTYYLGSNNSSINIYRVEVKDKAAGGETVDKAALTAAVEAAEAAIDAIAVDTDAANVAEGTKWILAADKATYQTAIDAAKAVATKADATQAEVDAAVTALATATTAFETAQKDGTKTEAPTVDKTALKADIAAAEKLAADTAITAQEDNLAGEKYWDSDMKTAYEAAIADAKAVADKADATADEVADAKAALATATATFKAGKTDGTKVLTEDEVKEALAAAIDAATAAKEGVVANDATDPSDVASGTKYVPTAVMDALEDALKDAEDLKALLDDEDAENDPAAEALTAALVALKNATTDFQPETGTKSSSSSGGGKPAIGSGTKPNGETTKTETLGDGTTVSTTTDAEGNTTVVTKRPDGLETTTVTNKDGDMVITTVNADDVTLAEVKVPGTIPANDQKFVDVPEGHWAEASINNMAALNMVKGVDDVNHIFDMNSDVTRGSVATILYRFANGKAGMSQDFSDVAEGQWYTDAVAWASNAGVVTGFENGTFQPDGSITREQLAVMIYRYAKLIGLDVSAKGDLRIFTDSDAIQSWAVDGMSWCVKNGIINGRGDGTVDPVTAATRAEAAAMLDRFVALLK